MAYDRKKDIADIAIPIEIILFIAAVIAGVSGFPKVANALFFTMFVVILLVGLFYWYCKS